jgi:hypothetical protein
VSIVSVSREAGPPHDGHVVATQSSAAPRGDVPAGLSAAPRRSGSRTGSWSSGTATSPHAPQCTIGMGAPQKRWRDSSQSRSR